MASLRTIMAADRAVFLNVADFGQSIVRNIRGDRRRTETITAVVEKDIDSARLGSTLNAIGLSLPGDNGEQITRYAILHLSTATSLNVRGRPKDRDTFTIDGEDEVWRAFDHENDEGGMQKVFCVQTKPITTAHTRA